MVGRHSTDWGISPVSVRPSVKLHLYKKVFYFAYVAPWLAYLGYLPRVKHIIRWHLSGLHSFYVLLKLHSRRRNKIKNGKIQSRTKPQAFPLFYSVLCSLALPSKTRVTGVAYIRQYVPRSGVHLLLICEPGREKVFFCGFTSMTNEFI